MERIKPEQKNPMRKQRGYMNASGGLPPFQKQNAAQVRA
jgi:hypothetical protein